MTAYPPRIVTASSSTLMRRGTRAVLSEVMPGCDWREAATDEELTALCEECAPDIVISDPCSRGCSLAVLQQMRRVHPNMRTLVVSDGLHGFHLLDAVRSGIEGFLRADCDAQEIRDALTACAAGASFMCGQILAALGEEGVDVEALRCGAWSCEPVWLTEREREVLTLIAEGLTHSQIAEKLHVSSHTVIAHRKNMQQKLGARNTASLVISAVRLGLAAPNRFLFKA
jgi:DNA-binding NarL/FixJ family response regulator